MPYNPPTITPSGTTFAQLRAGGFRGQVNRLIAANSFSSSVKSLIASKFGPLETGIVQAVDAYLQGEPVSTADINAKLLSYATALKAIAVALEEVNVLIDANPGTLANVASTAPTGHRKRRTFS